MIDNDDLWAEIESNVIKGDIVLQICKDNKIQVPDYYHIDCDQSIVFKKVIEEQFPEYFI